MHTTFIYWRLILHLIYIMNLNILKDLVYSGIDMYQFYNHIKHNEIIHGKKSFLTLKVNCSEQNNVNKR